MPYAIQRFSKINATYAKKITDLHKTNIFFNEKYKNRKLSKQYLAHIILQHMRVVSSFTHIFICAVSS